MFSIFLSFFLSLLDLIEVVLTQKDIKQNLRNQPKPPKSLFNGVKFPWL